MRPLLPLLLLAACASKVDLGDPIEDASDIARVCSEQTPTDVTLTVDFPEYADGCTWGEDGNLEMEDAHVTARVEEVQSLDLPADAVICDVQYDFAIDPEHASVMRYDDNFFFTFDDVVLAASYGPMVDDFTTDDDLPIYAWDAVAGTEFSFDAGIPTYCLGEADGLATCTIPPPETPGEMALDFDSSITAKLSYRAIDQDRVDFTFITIGDNDAATDCSHNDFQFDTTLSYVEP
jgi:hypothetical protein